MKKILVSLMTFCHLIPTAAAVSAPDVPEIAGVVIYRNDWTPFNMPYGVYTLPWAGNGDFREIVSGDDYNAYYGAVYSDGKLLTIAPGSFMGVKTTIHDTETWETIDYGTCYDELTFTAMASEPETNTIYCCYLNRDEEQYYWGTLSTQWYEPERLKFLDEDYYNAMAFAPDGTLYAITDKGAFGTVNPSRGTFTSIGDTGLRPDGISSAIYDPKSDKIFYALSSELKSALYSIDPATGAATHIYDMPGEEQIVGMYFPKSTASAGAPATAENLTATFADGAMQGTISFKIPTKTFDGATLSGDIDYSLSIDGTPTASGTAAAGSTVEKPVSLTTSGLHDFSVTLTNAAGASPEAKLSAFIGHDEIAAPSGLTSSYDGEAFNIAWQAPAGIHGGYVDPAGVTYSVTRMPENIVVATDITATNFRDVVAEPSTLTSVYHTVTATYNGTTTLPAKTGTIIIGSLTPPAFEDFKTKSGFDACTIIDNNNDRNSWNWAMGYVRYNYSSSNGADDYLVLPAMNLQAGKSYTFAMDAKCEDASDPERVAVYVGTLPEVSALTTEVIAPTTVNHTTWKTLEGIFVPETDGKYYFAVKACSDVYKYYLYVTNLSVSAPAVAEVPSAATSAAIIPADYGELAATVSFTAPATDIAGKALDALEKVEIYINDVLSATLAAEPGKAVTHPITVDKAATYTARIVAHNASGAGSPAEASAYIGLSKPKAPEFISAIQGDDVNEMLISWAPVQRDVNGTLMKASQLTYTLSRIDGSKTIEVAKGLKLTSYTDRAVEEGGAQKFVQYIVTAVNSEGESEPTVSSQEIAGPAYELPFTESVANGRLNHPLSLSWEGEVRGEWSLATDATLLDVKSQDGDNGFLRFAGDKNATGHLTTGRISLKGTTRPTLTFYYNFPGGTDNVNTLEISISTGGSFATLQTLTPGGTGDWKKCTIDLAAHIGREVQIRFSPCAANYRTLMIDNIRVFDLKDQDLTLSAIVAPAEAVSGRPVSLTATVRNSGAMTAEGYSVELLCDGEPAATASGTPLAAGEEATLTLAHTLPSWAAGEHVYVANIKFDSDQTPADNASEPLTVSFALPTLPQATNLSAGATTTDEVTLTWDAPQLDNREVAPVTDGAESYTSFSIGLEGSILADKDNIGAWTMIDGDGLMTLGAKDAHNQMLNYPNARAAMSFQIFTPSELGLTDAMWQPRSGKKMWICFSSLSGANNDWMISPELSGAAQTVSFHARSASSLYGKESLEVLASSTGKETADFTLVNTLAEVPTEWTEVTATLPEGTKYFAIRCTSDDKYALCIDDVTMITAEAADANLELLGYTVYRNREPLNDAPLTQTTLTDPDIAMETEMTYFVTALYNTGEAAPSNEVKVKLSALTDVKSSGARVSVEGQTIVISGLGDDETAAIYATDGRTLLATKGNARLRVIPGIYVVKAASATIKVAVR